MYIDHNLLKISKDHRQKFYHSKQWRTLRAFKLHSNPLCEICFKEDITEAATEVHHLMDIKDDPKLCLVIHNLKSLCKTCHGKITLSPEKNLRPKNLLWNRKPTELI